MVNGQWSVVKRGYSLVEMVVVMGIIAVIFAIGVGAILVSRNEQIAIDAAEQLKSDIRKAQVRAVSVEGANSDDPGFCPSDKKPRMWAIYVESGATNQYTFQAFCPNPSNLPNTGKWIQQKDPINFGGNITFSIQDNAGNTLNQVLLSFSTPFGRYETRKYDIQIPAKKAELSNASDPNSPWIPVIELPSLDDDIIVTLKYAGRESKVIIKKITGVAEVQ